MKARTGYVSHLLYLFVALLAVFIAGCGGKSTSTPGVASIEVTTQGGVPASIAKGTQLQFKATAILDNNSTRDVTTEVQWSSTNASAATVDSVTRKGEVTAVAPGTAGIKATFGDKSGTKVITVTAATVKSVQITPSNVSLPKGATRQLTATATLTDNTTQDLTTQAAWSSSKPEFVSIGNDAVNKGLATAIKAGASVVSASVGGVTASTNVTATAAAPTSLQITPDNPSNPKGSTRQFTATVIYSDGSNLDGGADVQWASSDTAIATIGNADVNRGIASALKEGVTTITATIPAIGLSDTTGLTVAPAVLVSLQVTPTNPAVAKGLKQQFTAMATYSDASAVDVTDNTNAVWSSSDQTVATISNDTSSRGLATTFKVGTTDVVISFGGKTASSKLTVTAAVIDRIEITPTTPSVAKGRTQVLTATAVFTDNSTQNVSSTVTWASSNKSVAEVGNASGNKGRVAAIAVGTTTISAALGAKNGSTVLTVTPAALTSIAVTPINSKLPAGFQQQFKATATFTDGTTGDVTTDVTWLSNQASIATISNADGSEGLLSAVAAGTTTITAKDPASSVQGSQTLTVTSATLSSIDVAAGNPPSSTLSLPLGGSLQFKALGHFSDSTTLDLTQQVAWSSTVETVATVSNASDSMGLAQSVSKGTTTIKATHIGTSSSVSGSATLAVTNAAVISIEVTPASASVAKGLTRQYTATGSYSNGDSIEITDQVTWSSSDDAKATISNATNSKGLATGTGVGSATVKATLDGVVGSGSLMVTEAELQSINVTPTAATVAKGDKPQYKATGIFSDSTTLDITKSVTWASSDQQIAQISNADGSEGEATALAAGNVEISASLNNKIGKTTLKVTSAVLRSMTISPANPSVPRGTSQQLEATATYSDGSTQAVTSSVSWTSSNSAIATVSNATGFKGQADANSEGQVTITAADPVTSVSATTVLKVTPARLTGILVQSVNGAGSANSQVPASYSLQYKATGQYSDGSAADITNQVLWSTLDPDVASISNAAGQKGLAKAGAAAGSTTVLASLGAVEGAGPITVTSAKLASIAVTPTDRTLNNNSTLQLVATGTFSDGSMLVLTKQVIWASSNTNLVTIGNAYESKGLATAVGFTVLPTAVTITAAADGKTGSTTVTRSN